MDQNPTSATANDDDWLLEDDEPLSAVDSSRGPWRILIVDDEPDIHAVTRMALGGFRFRDRPFEFLSAHSGAEGLELVRNQPDIALILLDVVMETETAGLQLAKRIREDLGNHLVRIVLRTGQPGSAPEDRVIVDYDINDYKAKTELTKQKLFTTVITSLRGYEDLRTIEQSRLGLERVLNSVNDLYRFKSLRSFASGLLHQVNAILAVETTGAVCMVCGSDLNASSDAQVLAATDSYESLSADSLIASDQPWHAVLQQSLQEKRNVFMQPINVLYVQERTGQALLMLIQSSSPLSEIQRSLLILFSERMATAFDNLQDYTRLMDAHHALQEALHSVDEHLVSTESALGRAHDVNAVQVRLQEAHALALGALRILGQPQR